MKINLDYTYSVDEGFINYWNEVIRPDENINICNKIG